MFTSPKFNMAAHKIDKIEHTLIDLCYIDIICFVQKCNGTISNDARLWKPINIQNDRYFNRTYARATILCLLARK